jgi:hypothetical protein
LEFVAEMTAALAWPAAAIIVVVLFKKRLEELLEKRPNRLRAGPFEAEWDRAASEVDPEIDEATAGTEVPVVGDLSAEFAEIAGKDPKSTILEAHQRIEELLRDLLHSDGYVRPAGPGRPHGAAGLARLARERNLITEQAAEATKGLTVLRNLAAHEPTGATTEAQAREFLSLADAVVFALSRRPDTGRSAPGHQRGVEQP